MSDSRDAGHRGSRSATRATVDYDQHSSDVIYEGVVLGDTYDYVSLVSGDVLFGKSFRVFSDRLEIDPSDVLNFSTSLFYSFFKGDGEQYRKAAEDELAEIQRFATSQSHLFKVLVFLKVNPLYYMGTGGDCGLQRELQLFEHLSSGAGMELCNEDVRVLNSFGWFELMAVLRTNDPANALRCVLGLRSLEFDSKGRISQGNGEAPLFLMSYTHLTLDRTLVANILAGREADGLMGVWNKSVGELLGCNAATFRAASHSPHGLLHVCLAGGRELAGLQLRERLAEHAVKTFSELIDEEVSVEAGLGRFDLAIGLPMHVRLGELLRFMNAIRDGSALIEGSQQSLSPVLADRIVLRFPFPDRMPDAISSYGAASDQQGICALKSVRAKLLRHLESIEKQSLKSNCDLGSMPTLPWLRMLNLAELYESFLSCPLSRDLVCDQLQFLQALPSNLDRIIATTPSFASGVMHGICDDLERSIQERFAGSIVRTREDFDLTSTQLDGLTRVLQAVTALVQACYNKLPYKDRIPFNGFVTASPSQQMALVVPNIIRLPYSCLYEVVGSAGIAHEVYHVYADHMKLRRGIRRLQESDVEARRFDELSIEEVLCDVFQLRNVLGGDVYKYIYCFLLAHHSAVCRKKPELASRLRGEDELARGRRKEQRKFWRPAIWRMCACCLYALGGGSAANADMYVSTVRSLRERVIGDDTKLPVNLVEVLEDIWDDEACKEGAVYYHILASFLRQCEADGVLGKDPPRQEQLKQEAQLVRDAYMRGMVMLEGVATPSDPTTVLFALLDMKMDSPKAYRDARLQVNICALLNLWHLGIVQHCQVS